MKKIKMITFAAMAATAAITFAGCSSGETEGTKASDDSLWKRPAKSMMFREQTLQSRM